MLQWRRWYTTGTVTLTNGSSIVVGATTGWANQVKPGDIFTRDKQRLYEVASVDSNTQITLAENFAGTGGAGQTYSVMRVSPAWNDTSDVALKLAAYLDELGLSLTPVPAHSIVGNATSSEANQGALVAHQIRTLMMRAPLSPPQISSDQNDYNPAGLSTANEVRLNSDAPRLITGLAGGVDGRTIDFLNAAAHINTLVHENSGSTAANRMSLPGAVDRVLLPNEAVILKYDATISRWRIASGVSAITKMSDYASGSWTPTWGGFSSPPAGGGAFFVRVGKLVLAYLNGWSAGTSNATTKTVTLPFTSARAVVMAGMGHAMDNSAFLVDPCRFDTRAGSAVCDVYKNLNADAWTASGACVVDFAIVYEMS